MTNTPEGTSGSTPMPGTLVDSATGAAGTLAGWAISTLGKKVRWYLYRVLTFHSSFSCLYRLLLQICRFQYLLLASIA
jgi:hypothetical protein